MSLDDRVSAELGAALLEGTVLNALDSPDYLDATAISAAFKMPVEKVEAICGRRDHEWESFDVYSGYNCRTEQACICCGAPRIDDEPYGLEFEP